MRKFIPFLCLLLAATCAFAAPKTIREAPKNVFIAKKGAWRDAKNWELKHAPKAERVNVANGGVATINSAVPEVEHISVYHKGTPSTLVVEDGGALKVRTFLAVWGNHEGDQAQMHVKGGQIQTATSGIEGALLVGTGGTFSGAAVATFSGGKHEGPIIVGSTLQQSHTGKLVVDGSAPELKAGKYERAYFLLAPSGTVEFLFDAKGVGTVDYTDSPSLSRFEAGSHIVIDGSRYRGGARTVALVAANRIEDNGATIEIRGFAPAYKTELLKKNGKLVGLFLKIAPAK